MRVFILLGLAWAASGCAGGPPQAPAAAPLVTFSFKEADVKTALDLIARLSDLHIVADHDVKGTVTLTAHNKPARDVLDEVVRSCGLKLTTHDSGLLRVSAP